MRVVLTGASGQLGAYLVECLASRRHEVVAWSGSESGERAGVPLDPVDLADPYAVADGLDEADPDAVLHAGAISSAEAARREPERARAINVEGTCHVAAWCRDRGRRLVYTSTDLVFDGSRPWNREDEPTGPLSVYGRTKLEAEAGVREVPRGLVCRVSLLYGPSRCGRANYLDRGLEALRRGEPQAFFEDEFRTPLDYPTAALILARLMEGEATGTVHVAGPERVCRWDLMRRIASAAGLEPMLVRANRRAEADLAEPRPADVSLETERLAHLLPDLRRPSIEEAAAGFGLEFA